MNTTTETNKTMKRSVYTILLVLTAQMTMAQTPPTLTFNGESSGDHIAAQVITLLPGFHTTSFSAKILVDAYIPVAKSNENYIYTRTFQKAMGSTSAIVENKDVLESITYFDGLGRPVQQIAVKASPGLRDIVTHMEYDAYGRMGKDFLPYEAPVRANEPSGSLRPGAEGDTYGYHTSNHADDLDANSPNPFSQKEFEPSPLNRVLKQAAPGKDWKLGSGHEIRFGYLANTATEVLLFKVGFTGNDTARPALEGGTAHYGANELYRNVTKDENWQDGQPSPKDHTAEEFTDKQGRTVLKRTYNDNDPHDTYYVHDDFGNLTYVIPPKVTLSITDGVSTTEMGELCYQYRYDHRNRLIEKKLPGRGWEHIVYNKLDRPIMTRDAQNPWLFTKYDAFGRVAYTGLANGGGRASVQSSADAHGTQWTNQGGTSTIDGQTVYYDDGGYPSASNITELHTINYYDNYNTARDGFAKPAGPIKGQVVAANVRGLATVSKVRVLDKDDWITTLTAYDAKGRPIYTKSENDYLNTVDIMETRLDFAGKPISTEGSHQKDGGTAIVVTDSFEYDHAARLTKQEQTLAGQTELIAANEYDAIGQLTGKNVGNTEGTPLQAIVYDYNIRGWLTGINDILDNANHGKLFRFNIGYNGTAKPGLENEGLTPLYNGNISNVVWGRDVDQFAYLYEYDAMNRITGAKWGDYYSSTSWWSDAPGNLHSLGDVSYDKNGNVLTLKRVGRLQNDLWDDLVYTNKNGNASNRLAKVVDQSTGSEKTEGFRDGANTGDDFEYDANGNMVQDLNKGIKGATAGEKGILYNHLNLPTKVTIDDGGANKGIISYIYDATGAKLRKNVLINGDPNPKVTDYAGNYVYENGNLKQFSTPEGYVQHDNGNYSYVYNFKDHLGNVRLSYSDIDKDGSVDQSEILHERNYYPFGMLHKGYNGNIQGSVSNFMEYQGQELDKSLNLDWHHFKYRTYDAAIGRFLQIDPLAPTYVYNSTYAFAENNVTSGTDLEGLELSIQLDGKRATGVLGPTQGTYSLQEAKSIIAQRQSAENEAIGRLFNDRSSGSTATVNYPSSNINRAAAVYPQSGLRLAQTVGVAAKEAATDYFLGGAILKLGKLARLAKNGDNIFALGKLTRVNESMSSAASSFQKQITGLDSNFSFKLSGVKFDGISDSGVLLDAKSGMKNFVGKDGNFAKWFKGSDSLVKQANRQLDAANGAKIEWHFENKSVMEATQKLFKKNDIQGIDLIHTPRQ